MAQHVIAKLWKPVVNVTDLDEGERFWSAVSGLSPTGRHGQFSVLDSEDESSVEPWMLLQLVPAGQVSSHSGTHLDFRVDDVAEAARQIEGIGGKTLKPPGIYELDGERSSSGRSWQTRSGTSSASSSIPCKAITGHCSSASLERTTWQYRRDRRSDSARDRQGPVLGVS